jgi:ABC-2 type transport system permease protein
MSELSTEPRQGATGSRLAPLPPRTPLPRAVGAVLAGQLGRVRVAAVPLLFVATLQSLGIAVLLRGVVHGRGTSTGASIVAGTTVLVVAFVALNLLSQRFGMLRSTRALDYYAAMPISAAAVVLGTAAAYASFTVPGALVTAVAGTAMYGLPFAQLWVVLPAVLLAAVVLAGTGAVLGLAMPRPELATVAGQLGMTAVLFLGIVPPAHLPELIRAVRVAVPGILAVDAIADALRPGTPWGDVVLRLAVTGGYGVLVLGLAGRLLRRAVNR